MQFEAGGADVDDQPRLAAGVDLAPEIADVDVDDVGLRQKFVVPDVLEQHRASDDLVGPAHEVFEQLELAWQEIDAPVAAPDRALDEIHFEWAGAQAGRARIGDAPRQRLDPRRQFAQFERLDEIIVAARLQAADAVVDRGEGADHQDRRRVAFLAKRLEDRQPVFVIEHAVDDQHRRAAGARDAQAFSARLGERDRITLGLKLVTNFLSERALVLDDQDGRLDASAGGLRHGRRSGVGAMRAPAILS